MQTDAQAAGRAAPETQVLSLPADAQVLFASDMHLGEHDQATAKGFCAALEQTIHGTSATRPPASHLILLGDLFEAWVGDDQVDRFASQLVDLLGALTKSMPVFVMRGNRDFLLDCPLVGADAASTAVPSFSIQTGVTMLADPCVLTIAKRRWVLTHGDALCTDDTAYQAFRASSRTAQWQRDFLQQPLAQRMALATQMRQQSEKEKANKSAYLTDVNQQAVQACLMAHDALEMIHGHTHRPDQHCWRQDDVDYRRHVLPDWDYGDSRNGHRGGFGWASADGFELNKLQPPTQ